MKNNRKIVAGSSDARTISPGVRTCDGGGGEDDDDDEDDSIVEDGGGDGGTQHVWLISPLKIPKKINSQLSGGSRCCSTTLTHEPSNVS